MKKLLAATLAITLTLGTTACGSSTQKQADSTPADTVTTAADTKTPETKYLKVSHVFAEGHPVYEAFKETADLLYEKTDGRYGLTIYPNGTYANYTDSITACQMGDLDIACLDSAAD